MKKLLMLLTVTMSLSAVIQAQAPAIFNYQGVARNSVGNVLVNKAITLRLTIHDGSAGGAVVYQESRGVTTNPFGLFNVQVGSAGATNVTGTIAGVNWAVGGKYIQVEIDPNGGTTFINIGTAQIASVPYAWYAAQAGDLILPYNKTQADNGTLFKITNSGTNAGSTAIEGLTNSTAGNAYAMIGTVTSTTPGGFSTGVRGVNNGTGGLGIGVYGSQAGSGWGVYGTTPSGLGVYGFSGSGTGVYGNSTSGTGTYGISTSGPGVAGTSSTGNAGRFDNTNAANVNSTVLVNSNSTGANVSIVQSNSLATTGAANLTALRGNNASTNDFGIGVWGGHNGSGWGVYGFASNGGAAAWAAGGYFDMLSGATPGGAAVRGNNFNNGGFAGHFIDVANTATSRALRTQGKLQLTGISEGLNKILTSDATGNATWQTIGAIGGVTGSGTVNFVPKWTPVGTNLGNSQIFDDGSRVNVGTNFGDPNSMTINNTAPGGGNAALALEGNLGLGNVSGMYLEQTTNRTHFTVNNYDIDAGTKVMTLDGTNQNVGVGIATPGARMHVVGSTNTNVTLGSAVFGHQAIIGKTSTTSTGNVSRGIIGYADNSTLENHGLFAYPNAGGAAFNVGVFALSFATTTGMNFGYYANVGGSSTGNIGIQLNVPSGANDFAGIFNGKVRIADGTQGAGRIFTSNAAGTGSWQTAAGAGLVSGSGTTNFMPKWTPNGTTLGNSNVWVDPTNFSTQINSTTMPVANALNVAGGWAQVDGTPGTFPFLYLNGPLNSSNSGFILGSSSGGADNGRILYRTAGDYIAIAHRDGGAGTNGLSDLVVKNGNVGIATTAPIARLHLDNSATGIGGMLVVQPNDLTNAPLKVLSGGAITFDLSGPINFGGIFSQRGDFTVGTLTYLPQPSAIIGDAPTGVGLQANSASGYGLVATSYTGTGVWAYSGGGGYALTTTGKVQIQGQGAANGYVLTSDATGNATWQDVLPKVGINLNGISNDLAVPNFTFVPITQWNTITYEDGGANYNPLTGEYTCTVSGVYQVSCHIAWYGFSASGYSGVAVFVNGSPVEDAFEFGTTGTPALGNKISTDIRVTAGDKISISVFTNTGATQTLAGPVASYANALSITLLHR